MGLSEQEDVFVHHNPYKISKTFDTANKVDQALTASRKPLPSIANHGSKSSESSARSSTQTTSLNTAAHSALVTALEYSLTKEKKQNDHLRKELNETKSELQKSIDRAEIIEQDLKEEERSRKMLMHQVAVLSDQILQLKEELQLAKTDQGKLSFLLDEERHYSTIFQQQATNYEESLRHEIALLKEQITEKEVQLRQWTLEYHPPEEGFDSLEECVRAMQSLARGKVFIKKQKVSFSQIL